MQKMQVVPPLSCGHFPPGGCPCQGQGHPPGWRGLKVEGRFGGGKTLLAGKGTRQDGAD
ncbi:MAG: hypothetical protein Fur0018_05430 [Anaerolineales bacterium]